MCCALTDLTAASVAFGFSPLYLSPAAPAPFTAETALPADCAILVACVTVLCMAVDTFPPTSFNTGMIAAGILVARNNTISCDIHRVIGLTSCVRYISI